MACQQIKAGHPVEIPEEIEVWRLCKMLRCTPCPGSLFEQPAYLMQEFQIIESELGGNEGEKALAALLKRLMGA